MCCPWNQMTRLWNDSGVRECLGHSKTFGIIDSAEYLLNSLHRITKPDYTPTADVRYKVELPHPVYVCFTALCCVLEKLILITKHQGSYKMQWSWRQVSLLIVSVTPKLQIIGLLAKESKLFTIELTGATPLHPGINFTKILLAAFKQNIFEAFLVQSFWHKCTKVQATGVIVHS